MIRLRFLCGHVVELDDGAVGSPTCKCGESRIVRVAPSRAPRFRGCRGPHADAEALPAQALDFAPKGSLRLKGEHG